MVGGQADDDDDDSERLVRVAVDIDNFAHRTGERDDVQFWTALRARWRVIDQRAPYIFFAETRYFYRRERYRAVRSRNDGRTCSAF